MQFPLTPLVSPMLTLALLLENGHRLAASDTLTVQHVTRASASRQAQEAEQAALNYASFWHTGDERYLPLALDTHFMDRTLPPGREQGLPGPKAASRAFRSAVPDLKAEVQEMIVADDMVTVRLHFTGHFTGRMTTPGGEIKGEGQSVDFLAYDMYRIQHGRITDNWHLEDNLSLQKQLGIH